MNFYNKKNILFGRIIVKCKLYKILTSTLKILLDKFKIVFDC